VPPASDIRTLFPLSVLAPALAKFTPPEGAFDPKGSWTHRYGVYTVGQRGCGRVGQAELSRKPAGDALRLGVRYDKTAAGGINHVNADIQCRADALASPVAWRVRTGSTGTGGKPVPRTEVDQVATLDGERIELAAGPVRRTLRVPSPFTLNWCLFDAVQRLPGEGMKPIPFTLLDDFDQVKPDQRLSFHGRVAIPLGGRPTVTHHVQKLEKGTIYRPMLGRTGGREVSFMTYSLTGRGIVPWVYYVDEAGRLLFAVSGIEGYVWEEAR